MIKAYCNRGIAYYRLVGLLIVILATVNNRWLRLLFSEIERRIS